MLEIGKAYDLKSHGHPSEEQKAEYVELADRLGVGPYLRERFMFAGTPDEVEAQLRGSDEGRGAQLRRCNRRGPARARTPDQQLGALVLPRFAGERRA